MNDVLVIGSGPAGLASAAELARHGIPATVLERGHQLAAAWAGRADGLRLNTSRWWSALPGAPFPREYGWFPTRDQYVDYLQRYAAHHQVQVRTGVDVRRIDPGTAGWLVRTDQGDLSAHHVVVATGIFNRPFLPAWARTAQADHAAPPRVLHAAEYRAPAPFRDQRVLVVGPGSTGMEVAHELTVAGAAQVWLAVRTPPTILLRTTGGLPGDLPVPMMLKLPVPLVDRLIARISRATVGDLTAHGLPPSPEGALSALHTRGAGTTVVDVPVLDAVKDGRISVVPQVQDIVDGGVVLADGTRLTADTVIAATGYSTGLEDMVGHLGVLRERGMPAVVDGGESAPGLRFVGYVYRPGITGFAGKLARRAARQIAAARPQQRFDDSLPARTSQRGGASQ